MAATDIPGENTSAIAENTQAIEDLEAALANERSRAITAETTCSTYTDTKFAAAGQAISALEITLKAYADAKAAQMMKYKGQKSVVSDLPSTGNSVGDVWDVAANGHNYAWNGTAWDDLGGQIDTSTLVSLSTYNTHVASTAHITAAERTLWNSTLSVSVGTVTALAYGQNPTVTNSGTGRNAVLNFGIPAGRPFQYSDFTQAQLNSLKGAQGDTGPAPTLSIGTVTIGDDQYDGDVTCTSTGTGSYAIGFTLPVGPKGDAFTYSDFTQAQLNALKGPKGDPAADVSVGIVSTLQAGNNATVSKDSASTASNVIFNFGIPRGPSPTINLSAQAGDPGTSPTVTKTSEASDKSYVYFMLTIPSGNPIIGRQAVNVTSGNTTNVELYDGSACPVTVSGSSTGCKLSLRSISSSSMYMREFLVPIVFSSSWTGSSFAVSVRKYSSSDTVKLYKYSSDVLDFTGVSAGDMYLLTFTEMSRGEFLVTQKKMGDVVEVTQT